MRAADQPLLHGYSMRDLDHVTRYTIAADRWHLAGADDRYAAVHHAIVEHLLTTPERPTRRDLVNVGLHASNAHVADEMHHHGWDRRDMQAGRGALPGFQRFWQTRGHLPWDETLIERYALAQIWPHLTDLQQQAIEALAATGDHQAAADALGLHLPAFSARLRLARRAVLGLWHEHETPRPLPRDKRVRTKTGTWNGRRLLTEADLDKLRQRRTEGATYAQLAAETGYSAGALCNLLRGKRRPVAERTAA
ncbi:helix-turn-helix domain-containing protein [Streptomyces sp. NPDC007025]|uniref:helix-turn-helix domain-containing protein n=1 Tax=Streptomyces sp. NPDC007025 TaxID=3364771 RepID=UPI0036CEFABF